MGATHRAHCGPYMQRPEKPGPFPKGSEDRPQHTEIAPVPFCHLEQEPATGGGESCFPSSYSREECYTQIMEGPARLFRTARIKHLAIYHV